MASYIAVGDDGRILCSGSGCSGTQNSGTGKHLNGVARAGINRSNGVMLVLAVGNAGTVVRKKTNSEWEELSSGTSRDLNGVVFARGTKTAWAVGDEGTILKTTDGGSSWAVKSAGTGRPLRAVAAVDESAVWATGDGELLLRSDDGGESWAQIHDGSRPLRGLCAATGQIIAVGDEGIVLDGDRVTHITTKHLRAVARAPGGLTIAVGDEGTIARREADGWRMLSDITDKALNGVVAWDDDHWVIVGDDGEILVSSDGGAGWEKSQRGSKRLLAVG